MLWNTSTFHNCPNNFMKLESGLYKGHSLARTWLSQGQSLTISALWTGLLSCCDILACDHVSESLVKNANIVVWLHSGRTLDQHFLIVTDNNFPNYYRSLVCAFRNYTRRIKLLAVSSTHSYFTIRKQSKPHFISLRLTKSCVACTIDSGWAQFWVELKKFLQLIWLLCSTCVEDEE